MARSRQTGFNLHRRFIQVGMPVCRISSTQYIQQNGPIVSLKLVTYILCVQALNLVHSVLLSHYRTLFSFRFFVWKYPTISLYSPLLLSRSQLINGSLYINSVVEDQGLTGAYQCMASLPNVGSIVSKTARLSLASM